MDRKAFTICLAAGMLGAARPRAQPAAQVRRIGWLIAAAAPSDVEDRRQEILRAALGDLGWVEGRNLAIEIRYTGADPPRMREAAAQLKSLGVALIIANGSIAIRAARDGAAGVPVVMVNAGDPQGSGFVASLVHPGGDLTGTSAAGEEVLAKQVELLTLAVPGLNRVSVLMNSANPTNGFFFVAMSSRAKGLGLQLDRMEISSPDELDGAIARAKGGAMVVLGDPMLGQHRLRIIEAAARHRVPAIYGNPLLVTLGGGLMSYLSSDAWHWRKAAGFVDKILKGAKPGDLPVEQPTEFALVINLKTAKALGLTIPQSLLLRADEVIQ
jgi:putative ABC transport system substrate-binding protein